jgi:hypothetical protein
MTESFVALAFKDRMGPPRRFPQCPFIKDYRKAGAAKVGGR